jgi:metal-responsive CopG/Arc/MetJ family transcriptional regulator
MSRAVKVAISLPGELLDSAAHAREASGETRSEFFRRAIEVLLLREEQQTAIDEYVEAYRRYPESDEEILVASQQSSDVLALEPWE